MSFLGWVAVGMVLWLPLSLLTGWVVGRTISLRDDQERP